MRRWERCEGRGLRSALTLSAYIGVGRAPLSLLLCLSLGQVSAAVQATPPRSSPAQFLFMPPPGVLFAVSLAFVQDANLRTIEVPWLVRVGYGAVPRPGSAAPWPLYSRIDVVKQNKGSRTGSILGPFRSSTD